MMDLDWLLPKEVQDRRRKQREERRVADAARRIPLCVPWTDDIKWAPELNIQARTWKNFSLFDVAPTRGLHPDNVEKDAQACSPDGKWHYNEVLLAKGQAIETIHLSRQKKGTILFDGDIRIPRLFDRGFGGHFDHNPFMSLTPMEYMTLRPGTARAKGRTLVVGLGLGYQLIEVSKRKQVKELVLIEKDQGLVDWLLPRILPKLHRKLDDVIVGDAYQLLPSMKADIALVDIYRGIYGRFERRLMREAVRMSYGEVKALWNWGSEAI